MSRWFRHYAGMMRDDKLVRAALKSKQPVERVVWVWGAILESAAEIDDGGRYEIDHAEMGWFLRVDEGDILAIENALSSLDRVNSGCVAHWKDRQFHSDRSAERQRRYRDRQKGDGDDTENDTTPSGVTVTPPSPLRNGDAPHTDTQAKTETEIPLPLSTEPREEDFSPKEICLFVEEHPLLDIPKQLRDLSAWCDRKKIFKPNERRTAITSLLREKTAQAEGGKKAASRSTGPPIPAGAGIVATLPRLMRRA